MGYDYPDTTEDLAVKDRADEDKGLRCVFCGAPITAERHRTEKGGSWSHTFTNPAGYIYRIGCYSSAPGCLNVGDYSGEFTWFRGYHWCYALCGNCTRHLGWHFSGQEGSDFFGIVLEYLAG